MSDTLDDFRPTETVAVHLSVELRGDLPDLMQVCDVWDIADLGGALGDLLDERLRQMPGVDWVLVEHDRTEL